MRGARITRTESTRAGSWNSMKKTFTFACLAMFIPFASAYADQGGFTNAGGSLSGGTSVANPPGTLTIAGGTLTFLSTDGTTAIAATFSESSTVKEVLGRRQRPPRDLQLYLHGDLQRHADGERSGASDQRFDFPGLRNQRGRCHGHDRLQFRVHAVLFLEHRPDSQVR